MKSLRDCDGNCGNARLRQDVPISKLTTKSFYDTMLVYNE